MIINKRRESRPVSVGKYVYITTHLFLTKPVFCLSEIEPNNYSIHFDIHNVNSDHE